VTEARHLADVVLVDTGALLSASEAGELIGLVDSVLLVAQIGRTDAAAAARAAELLLRFGAPAAGVVLLSQSSKASRTWRRKAESPAPVGAIESPPAAAEVADETPQVPETPVLPQSTQEAPGPEAGSNGTAPEMPAVKVRRPARRPKAAVEVQSSEGEAEGRGGVAVSTATATEEEPPPAPAGRRRRKEAQ